MAINEMSDGDFEERDGRRQGGHCEEDKERRAKQLSTRKFSEEPWKHSKDEARATGAWVESGNGETGREDDESREQCNAGVEEDPPPRGAYEAFALAQVAPVGQHGAHAQAEREESLSESSVNH